MIYPAFNITDVSHQGGRSLIYVNKVMSWVDQLGTRPTDVHKSMYRYSKDIREYLQENNNSTRGYRGKAYADYIPVEIDGETVEESGQVGLKVYQAVQGKLHIEKEALPCFYSGNRGFHILIPTDLFGDFEPDEEFHRIMAEAVIFLLRDTDLIYYQEEHNAWRSDAIDFNIYAPQHMLRVPNTVHESSSLYKIPILPEMMAHPEQVREKAGEPRPMLSPTYEKTEQSVEIGDKVRAKKEQGALSSTSQRTSSLNFDKMLQTARERASGGPGSARYAARHQKYLDILKANMVDGEQRGGEQGRRKCLLVLAGHLKYHGIPKDEAIMWLKLWNQQNQEPLDDTRFFKTIKYTYQR